MLGKFSKLFLSLVCLSLLVATPGQANILSNFSQKFLSCQERVNRFFNKRIQIQLTEQEKLDLEYARKMFLLADKRPDSTGPRERKMPGGEFSIGGEIYTVTNLLGEGREGIVYEVQNSRAQNLIIKKFFSKRNARMFTLLTKEVSSRGFRVVTPKMMGKESVFLQFDYFRGVPLNYLFIKGEQWGLPQKLLSDVKVKFASIPRSSSYGRESFNFVLDIDTGDIVLVDPF